MVLWRLALVGGKHVVRASAGVAQGEIRTIAVPPNPALWQSLAVACRWVDVWTGLFASSSATLGWAVGSCLCAAVGRWCGLRLHTLARWLWPGQQLSTCPNGSRSKSPQWSWHFSLRFAGFLAYWWRLALVSMTIAGCQVGDLSEPGLVKMSCQPHPRTWRIALSHRRPSTYLIGGSSHCFPQLLIPFRAAD